MSDQAKAFLEEQKKKLSEFRQKEFEVRSARIEREHNKISKDKAQLNDLSKLTLEVTPEYIKKVQEETVSTFTAATKKLRLFHAVPELSDVVPFYNTELILMGARTGTGKTTACVNIAHTLILQGKRPFLILNEESASSFLIRLAGLFLNKRIGNFEKLDQDTKDRVNAIIPKLMTRIMVVDADYGKKNGLQIESLTNSIEGLKMIQKKLMDELERGIVFDAIINDYYQKFNASVEHPDMKTYECQEIAAGIFESLRTTYPAPIVMFAQMTNGKEEDKNSDKAPFEERIMGRKVIVNYATVVLELIANREESTTEFKLHKGRNMDYIKGTIKAGWEDGKYVQYDEEFKKRINQKKILALEKQLSKEGKEEVKKELERKVEEYGQSDARGNESPI